MSPNLMKKTATKNLQSSRKDLQLNNIEKDVRDKNTTGLPKRVSKKRRTYSCEGTPDLHDKKRRLSQHNGALPKNRLKNPAISKQVQENLKFRLEEWKKKKEEEKAAAKMKSRQGFCALGKFKPAPLPLSLDMSIKPAAVSKTAKVKVQPKPKPPIKKDFILANKTNITKKPPLKVAEKTKNNVQKPMVDKKSESEAKKSTLYRVKYKPHSGVPWIGRGKQNMVSKTVPNGGVKNQATASTDICEPGKATAKLLVKSAVQAETTSRRTGTLTKPTRSVCDAPKQSGNLNLPPRSGGNAGTLAKQRPPNTETLPKQPNNTGVMPKRPPYGVNKTARQTRSANAAGRQPFDVNTATKMNTRGMSVPSATNAPTQTDNAGVKRGREPLNANAAATKISASPKIPTTTDNHLPALAKRLKADKAMVKSVAKVIPAARNPKMATKVATGNPMSVLPPCQRKAALTQSKAEMKSKTARENRAASNIKKASIQRKQERLTGKSDDVFDMGVLLASTPFKPAGHRLQFDTDSSDGEVVLRKSARTKIHKRKSVSLFEELSMEQIQKERLEKRLSDVSNLIDLDTSVSVTKRRQRKRLESAEKQNKKGVNLDTSIPYTQENNQKVASRSDPVSHNDEEGEEEKRNLFESSAIRFSITTPQQHRVGSLLHEDGTYVITTVRRTTKGSCVRSSQTLRNQKSVVESLDDVSREVRLSAVYWDNDAFE